MEHHQANWNRPLIFKTQLKPAKKYSQEHYKPNLVTNFKIASISMTTFTINN